MKYLTDLQILTKAAKGMLKQNKKSQSTTGTCKYNGPNDTHCGVGFLIYSSKYNVRIEGKAVHGIDDGDILHTTLLKSKININDSSTRAILESIQDIHDNYQVNYWREKITDLAKASLSGSDYDKFSESIAKIKPKK